VSTVQSAPAFQISPSAGGHGLTLSDSAAQRLAQLGAAEGHPVLLRVAVDGGGCSGFQYRFELVEAAEPDDIRIAAWPWSTPSPCPFSRAPRSPS